MQIHLRNAELYDLTQIDNIEQRAHVSPWSKSLLASSFGERNHNVLVEVNGEICGYLFSSFVAGELTLENICVANDKQGLGLGSKLMQQLDVIAESLDAEEIWLEVRVSNLAAIHLYEKFGFRQQGTRKNYYSLPQSNEKEDALLMKKTRT